MIELISEIEALLPPGWTWLLRSTIKEEQAGHLGDYFANIHNYGYHRGFAQVSYRGHADTPLGALQNAYDAFVAGEQRRGRLQ